MTRRHPSDCREAAESSSGTAIDTVPARCPHCFSRQSGVVAPFRASGIGDPWKVVRCAECDLMYTDPKPRHEEWERFYPDDYPAYRDKPERNHWHSRLRRRLQRWLLHLYRGYPAPGRASARRRLLATVLAPVLGPLLDPRLLPMIGERLLLDIGCGSGEYLARMRTLGWEVIGIDRNPHSAELARQRHGVPVFVGTLPCDEFPSAEFDLVTAWQVLEHLDRPRQTLAFIREALRPEGRLVLTVPNQAGWAARHFGPDWIGLDLPRHLTHFTPETLCAMLRAEGFVIIHQSTVGQSGWIRHSARQAKRNGAAVGKWAFTSKPLSRTVSAGAVRRGLGESIFVVAEQARQRRAEG